MSSTLDVMTGQTGPPTGLMCASLSWVTLGPVTCGVEGRDADLVLGVAGEILDLHHGFREEEDFHFLSLVAAVCLPVVNLLGRAHTGHGWNMPGLSMKNSDHGRLVW